MSDDIHDLLREVDKAIDRYRYTFGASNADLRLKLPKACEQAFIELGDYRIKDRNEGKPAQTNFAYHYLDIPITEWTDGPFMSFSLDWAPFANLPATPPDHIDCMGTWPNGLRGRCAPMQLVTFDEHGNKTPVDPAYVAITLKASDKAPCPECWTVDGHDAGCSMEAAEREWKPGDSVVLPLLGETKIKRITDDDPDSITIPLVFERGLTIEEAAERLVAIGNTTLDGAFNDGDGIEVTLSAPVSRRVSDHTMAAINHLAMKFMCDVRELLDAADKPKPEDESVHRAIAAMQKPGRANEL